MCHCTKEGKWPLFLRKSPKPEKSSSGSNHPQHGWCVLRQVKKEEVSTRLTSVECISFYNVVELGVNSFFQGKTHMLRSTSAPRIIPTAPSCRRFNRSRNSKKLATLMTKITPTLYEG